MSEEQMTAEFEREQARKYRLDATQILRMAQQAGLLDENYVSSVDVVENIIAELMRTRSELEQTRAELARAERVNVETKYRVRQAAHENVKMNARLVQIYKRAARYKCLFHKANVAKRAARGEATREMEW